MAKTTGAHSCLGLLYILHQVAQKTQLHNAAYNLPTPFSSRILCNQTSSQVLVVTPKAIQSSHRTYNSACPQCCSSPDTCHISMIDTPPVSQLKSSSLLVDTTTPIRIKFVMLWFAAVQFFFFISLSFANFLQLDNTSSLLCMQVNVRQKIERFGPISYRTVTVGQSKLRVIV